MATLQTSERPPGTLTPDVPVASQNPQPQAERRGKGKILREPPPNWSEQPNSSDAIVLTTLAKLISMHGARCITHWHAAESTTEGELCLAITSSTQAMEDSLEQKAEACAVDCLKNNEVVSKIVSSGEQCFVVAAPVPTVAGYAITVVFPMNRSGDAGQSKAQRSNIQLRCSDVAITAAHLSIVKLNQQIAALKQAKDLTPDSEGKTWAQAWQPLAGKLKQLPRDCCRSKLNIAIAFICILGLALIPWPYSLRCKVTCEPAKRRFVAAPFDGELAQSKVSAGETVVAGQLLAVMEGSDLRSEIAGLEAKYSQASQRRSAALATGDASNAELERLEMEQLDGQIQVLQTRQDKLEIRAPIDGVVVTGNLERVEGAPLKVGDNLFEIAPLNALIAEIEVPEAEVAMVEEGLYARISLNSEGGRSHDSTIARIHPRNEVRENQSVFIAEAELDNLANEVRPGMTGFARVSVGMRSAGWILFHRPYEYVRQWVGW